MIRPEQTMARQLFGLIVIGGSARIVFEKGRIF